VQPDERRVVPLPGGRDQDVDQVRPGLADAVVAQRGQPGNQAAATCVQQRGHFLLEHVWGSGRGQVNPGQQLAPRSARPEPLPQRTPGHTCIQRLMACYDVKLLAEESL
jgi:hypothetical protein